MPTKTGPSAPSFDRAARALESAFFLKQDALLIERLRAMKEMTETKEALAAVSGITNDLILTRLVELDVKPEIVAALVTVPLIEVVWADGEIDADERQAVLSHADEYGIRPGSIEHELLERWLLRKPSRKLLAAWQAYMQGLCERLSAAEREVLKRELLHSTLTTAEASGGLFGVGRVSEREKQVLAALAASFGS